MTSEISLRNLMLAIDKSNPDDDTNVLYGRFAHSILINCIVPLERKIEEAAKIAEPWPGFADIKQSKTDKIINSVRREIAEKIRELGVNHD